MKSGPLLSSAHLSRRKTAQKTAGDQHLIASMTCCARLFWPFAAASILARALAKNPFRRAAHQPP